MEYTKLLHYFVESLLFNSIQHEIARMVYVNI